MNLVDLPESLQSAELLAGNAILRGCAPVTLLAQNSPAGRAHALPVVPSDAVFVSGNSAAWVWGARRDLQLPLELAVDFRHRVSFDCPVPHKRRELILQDADVVRLGKIRVTTPARTVFELLRSRSPFTNDVRATCRLLLASQPNGRELLDGILAVHPRSPNVRLVRTRLAGMY
jgi:hypothetical protein